MFYFSFFAVVFPSKHCQYRRHQFNITHPWNSDVWRCRLDCVISAGWKITSVEVRVSLHSVRRGTPCLWPPDRRSWASRQKSEFAGPQSRHQCFHRFLALQHELVSIRMVTYKRVLWPGVTCRTFKTVARCQKEESDVFLPSSGGRGHMHIIAGYSF